MPCLPSCIVILDTRARAVHARERRSRSTRSVTFYSYVEIEKLKEPLQGLKSFPGTKIFLFNLHRTRVFERARARLRARSHARARARARNGAHASRAHARSMARARAILMARACARARARGADEVEREFSRTIWICKDSKCFWVPEFNL